MKEKSDKDLQGQLEAKRKSLRLFRFGVAGSKSKNVKEGRTLRRDIARILTEINARKQKHV